MSHQPRSPPASSRSSSSSSQHIARARLPAVGPRDRRGRRPHLPLHRAQPPGHRSSELGYLRRDPTKPRAIEVRYDPNSGAPPSSAGRSATCPLVGDVAAGTDVLAQENVEEILPAARRLHRRRRPVHAPGPGRLDDRRRHPRRRLRRRPGPAASPSNGDIVVAGIPGDEATVKTYTRKGDKVVLLPGQPARSTPMVFDAAEVAIFGKVVTVMRKL